MSTTYRCTATVHVTTPSGTVYGADRDQDVHVDEQATPEQVQAFFIGVVVEQLRAAGHEGPATVVSYSATPAGGAS